MFQVAAACCRSCRVAASSGCNVAVSRHGEALIVLGHPSIAAAPNWSQVLTDKYFQHIEDNSGRGSDRA
ncbi:hypothetical protein PRIPAC_90604 [Pristionchus pacificus]|uniref:Uncharacterized protein n=1 Tax=Pristionchus pacificus TaxID=54126 RepID=A0A2A6CYF0_PRIPA|nr:hypothetical protein PRIPAC_90604 [Pristionchus pacificus]|eukprot:PDM83242.1 hypothetical protein PRIPAC_34874 [Pristionchus pacificus]